MNKNEYNDEIDRLANSQGGFFATDDFNVTGNFPERGTDLSDLLKNETKQTTYNTYKKPVYERKNVSLLGE